MRATFQPLQPTTSLGFGEWKHSKSLTLEKDKEKEIETWTLPLRFAGKKTGSQPVFVLSIPHQDHHDLYVVNQEQTAPHLLEVFA